MKSLPVLFFLFCSIVTAAQSNSNGIAKVDAYFLVALPGIVPSRESGQRMPSASDTTFFVYLQTKDSLPAWTRAWKGGESYAVQTVLVKERPLQVGFGKASGKAILLSPNRGCRLYRLTFEPQQSIHARPTSVRGHFVLKGTRRAKPVFLVINKFTQLAAPMYQ